MWIFIIGLELETDTIPVYNTCREDYVSVVRDNNQVNKKVIPPKLDQLERWCHLLRVKLEGEKPNIKASIEK